MTPWYPGEGFVNSGNLPLPQLNLPDSADNAAHRGAVAADVLGGGMDDHVRAPIHRPAEVRRRHGVVDDERDFGFVRDLRQRLDVDDVDGRVTERLGVDELRIGFERPAEILRLVGMDEGRLDAELLQVHLQQRVCRRRASTPRRCGRRRCTA